MSSPKDNEGSSIELQQTESPQNEATIENLRRNLPTKDGSKTINVAVSSRALFNLEEEYRVFETQELEDYTKLQLNQEDTILEPGAAFPFIKALENVNAKLKERDPDEKDIFTIALFSKDDTQVRIRLQKSIDHYGLKGTINELTSGDSLVENPEPFNINLYLTSYKDDVVDAIRRGIPAAVMSLQPMNSPSETQLKIAFDLDAVLFSDESERIYKEQGLDAFLEHEKEHRDNPLTEGPLKPFAEAIGRMQKKFGRSAESPSPIRTYIVTSRNAVVGQRALLTLRHWGLEIDECFFMADAPKEALLETINPHIFLDDQISHVRLARSKTVCLPVT